MLSVLSIGPTRQLLCAVLFASLLAGISGSAQELGAKEIIQRSVEVNRSDWDLAPGYDYNQRERDGENSKTYEEIMLAGSRYERLVAIDDKPLSPAEEAKERRRFQKAIAQRQQESPDEREQRVEKYQKEIDRDHALMAELTKALDFTLSGKETLGRHEVYVLKGMPRAGYRPLNKLAKALTGMQGTLWIDAVNFHWVKAEAEVVSPVWLYGFAARIEPGTHFELEQVPITTGLWMPNHFSMQAKAKVLLLFPHYEQDDITYSNYHKPGTSPADSSNDVKMTGRCCRWHSAGVLGPFFGGDLPKNGSIEMHKIVLLRHGESVWNQEDLFTGWTDVDLSDKGRQEAKEAGLLLKEQGYSFDVAFTSLLKRAIRTLWIVLDEMDLMWIPVQRDWRLNERHYGALQGLNKAETAAKYGEQQVKLWRRSYDIRPPMLDEEDPRYPGKDPRYKDIPKQQLPLTECLKDTVARFLPCWHQLIAPSIRSGKQVLIAAHGNSLRALVKYLEDVPEQQIIDLNIPTGVPLVQELDDDLKSLRHYYLGDPVQIQQAINGVASVGQAKN